MTGPGISSDDELTVEALQRKKEDLHEHGLGDSPLTDAVDQQIEEREREDAKRKRLVEKKILLKQAEKAGLEDDPDVEALRASVEDLGEELEAEALKQDEAAAALEEFQDKKFIAEHDEDLPEEAKHRLQDFKMLREQASTPALRQLYQEKMDALHEEHAEVYTNGGDE